ncbi:MAG: hypothetical protein ACRDHD_01875 [Candidatus Limnocylindria bacterium]
MDDLRPPVQLGATGRLVAQPLTNAVGDHALLVRQGEAARALLTGEAAGGAADDRDRIVIVPMDDDVELRMDGDALAIWLATGSVRAPAAAVPGWASALGLLLVLGLIAFAVLGSITFFGWLLEVAG